MKNDTTDQVTTDIDGLVHVALCDGDEPKEMTADDARELASALLVAADIAEEGIHMDPIGDGPVPRDMAIRILRELWHFSLWPTEVAEGLRELREMLESTAPRPVHERQLRAETARRLEAMEAALARQKETRDGK